MFIHPSVGSMDCKWYSVVWTNDLLLGGYHWLSCFLKFLVAFLTRFQWSKWWVAHVFPIIANQVWAQHRLKVPLSQLSRPAVQPGRSPWVAPPRSWQRWETTPQFSVVKSSINRNDDQKGHFHHFITVSLHVSFNNASKTVTNLKTSFKQKSSIYPTFG